jgi:tRNA pseudouridine55 synthase
MSRETIHGWVNFDKPAGMTSTQAIGRVRRLLNVKKLGHAGTLDPLATGILPVALGEATKTIAYAQDLLKTYRFSIIWGEQRDTDDAEGVVIATSEVRPSHDQIMQALPRFIGNISQTPPRYSAIKIEGERAYDRARQGEDFDLRPRPVFVKNLRLIDDNSRFEMICGKGTYVRSIARDLAEILGTKGYVTDLRRLAVGQFSEIDAISLDFLENLPDIAHRKQVIKPLDSALDDILALSLRADEATRLRNGQALSFVSRPDYERLVQAGLANAEGKIALAYADQTPLAMVSVEGVTIRSVRVFNL